MYPFHYSFLIIHFSFSTSLFIRVTSVVSWRNKQCCLVSEAMPSGFTSNAGRFHKQCRLVLLTNPTGFICNPAEYCLQRPRVLLVSLASRTSVAHEPCKCCFCFIYHLLASSAFVIGHACGCTRVKNSFFALYFPWFALSLHP